MADRYFSNSVDDNWSTIGNWWTDAARTGAAGATPTNADDVHFDGISGDCILDVGGVCATIDFTNGTNGDFGGSDTFDFNNNSLSFYTSCDLSGVTDPSVLLMSDPSTSLTYNGEFRHGSLTGYPGMTIDCRLMLYNPTASLRRLSCYNDFTITELGYYTTSSGAVEFYNASGQQSIVENSAPYGGTGHHYLNSPASGAGRRTLFVQTARFDKLESVLGFFELGRGNNVAVYLNSDLQFQYGDGLWFTNDTIYDRTVIFYTTGSGGLYVAGDIRVETSGTGDLTLSFGTATMRHASSYSYWADKFLTSRSSPTSKLYIFWGTDNEYAFTEELDCNYVSDFAGSNCIFTLQGQSIQTYTAPHWNPDFTYPWLPGALIIKDYASALSHFCYLNYNVRIAGSMDVYTDYRQQTLVMRNGTKQIIGGDFTWSKSTSTPSWHTHQNAVEYQGDYLVTSSGTDLICAFEDEDIDFYGDVVFGVSTDVDQAAAGTLTVHVPKNGDRRFYSVANASPDSFGGTVVFDHDDDTNEGGSYDLHFLINADIYIRNMVWKTSVDQSWDIEFSANVAVEYAFMTLDNIDAPGVDPCDIASSPLVHLKSHTPDTQWHMSLDVANPDITFAKFTDCANDGDYFGTPENVKARDGTSTDGGNNTGIDWTHASGSLALCPSDLVTFFAYRGAQLPSAQKLNLVNLIGGTLASPIQVSGEPAWLDVSEVTEDGQRKAVLQPNTTDLSPGLYQDDVDITTSGALRTPVDVDVDYTIADGVVPVPAPADIDFYVMRDRTFPDSVNVDVINPYDAEVMAEIEVYDVPAWLDIEINPAGPPSSSSSESESSESSDSYVPYGNEQSLRITVNDTGMQLISRGTYTARIGITAANADADQFIDVTLVVEAIIMNALPTAFEFTMIKQKALPGPQGAQIGNEGDPPLGTVTLSNPVSWLMATLTGSGELRFLDLEIKSVALSLDAGVYEADLELLSDATNSPFIVPIILTVEPGVFNLIPSSVLFVPTVRWLVSDVKQIHVVEHDYAIIEPVTIAGAPAWLDVQVDASDLSDQVITLTIIQVVFNQIEDPDEYEQTLLITAVGNPSSTTLPLPVSIQTPAFFRRPECDMDFVPKIDGILVEDCAVPPPPPPAPVIPLVIPPVSGGGGYSLSASMTGGPCLTCEAKVESGGELGYLSPTVVIECTEHGCGASGPYCTGEDWIVSTITTDECGHVCSVICETDDVGGDGDGS